MALAWGSVVMVTALQVTALLFALPIYARLTKSPGDPLGVAVGGDLAGFAGGGHHRRRPGGRPAACVAATRWAIVAAVMGPLLVLCVLAARIWSGRPVAAVLLAVVAGSSLALFAVLTKGVVEVAEGGFGAVLRSPEFYPWLLVALAGMIFQQSAFRAGALTASLPTMTVAKPVVAGALGVIVLARPSTPTGAEVFVLIAAVAMVIVATVALARGEAATMAAETGRTREDRPDASHDDGAESPVRSHRGSVGPA